MQIEKRMTRFKNIQLLEIPENIESWYKTIKYSEEKITVFKLHHMISIDEEEREVFFIDLRKQLKKEEKIESNILSTQLSVETDLGKLKELIEQRKHRELVPQIINRMLSINEDIYLEYIHRLDNQYTEDIFDNAIAVLIETSKKKDISNEILDLLKKDKIRDPQDFAVLSQIMGLGDTNNIIMYLYSFYRYFINNFPDENYFEGPLFGISYYLEIRRRTTAST